MKIIKLFSFILLDKKARSQIMEIMHNDKYDSIEYYGKSRGDLIRKIADEKSLKKVVDFLISILLDKNEKDYWIRTIDILWNGSFDEDYLYYLPASQKNRFIGLLYYCAEIYPELNLHTREHIWPFVVLLKNISSWADWKKPNEKGYYNPLEDENIIKELNKFRKNYGVLK